MVVNLKHFTTIDSLSLQHKRKNTHIVLQPRSNQLPRTQTNARKWNVFVASTQICFNLNDWKHRQYQLLWWHKLETHIWPPWPVTNTDKMITPFANFIHVTGKIFQTYIVSYFICIIPHCDWTHFLLINFYEIKSYLNYEPIHCGEVLRARVDNTKAWCQYLIKCVHVTGGFPSQRTSNTGNVCIWSRHHGCQRSNRKSNRQ